MNTQVEGFMTQTPQTPQTAQAAPAAATAQVGRSRPHESAVLHVAGEATYTDDIPEVQGTLHCALGASPRAHARILSLDLDAVRRAPGVVAVFTAADIPGVNDCGPVVHDDPILADGVVQYIGQPMFAVVAESHDAGGGGGGRRTWPGASTKTCPPFSRRRPPRPPVRACCRRCSCAAAMPMPHCKPRRID